MSALFAAASAPISLPAAVTSFLSPIGAIGGGATPGDSLVELDLDGATDTGSLYLWLQNDEMLRTASFDITTTTPGVIEFLGAEVLQADLIDGNGNILGSRWNLPLSNGRVQPGGQKISNFVGVNVTQHGLNPVSRTMDSLYDPAANAAVFARIDFRALTAGTTNVELSMGKTLTVEAGKPQLPAMTFGTTSVRVTGSSAVPPLALPPATSSPSIPPSYSPPAVPATTAKSSVTSFLSPVGAVGGAQLGNPLVQMDLDEGADTGSLFLWLRNEEMLRSAAFNIATSTPGVIEFTGAEIFQADILDENGIDVGDRWNLPTGNGRIEWDRQQITNFAAVNVTASGLDPATRTMDSLYDPEADAALFARIDFRALAAGTTDLHVSMGDTLIVEAGSSVLPEMSFGSASISVTGNSIRAPLAPPAGTSPPKSTEQPPSAPMETPTTPTYPPTVIDEPPVNNPDENPMSDVKDPVDPPGDVPAETPTIVDVSTITPIRTIGWDSLIYRPAIDRPYVTVWKETDHFTHWINSNTIDVMAADGDLVPPRSLYDSIAWRLAADAGDTSLLTSNSWISYAAFGLAAVNAPEPSTFALAGVVALAFVASRRRTG